MDKNLKNAMRMLGESADKLFEAELPESMLDSYLVTALWSTADTNDKMLDDTYSISDITKEFKEKAKKDCDDFLTKAKEIVKKIDPEYVLDESLLGHEFWLTRNGHGAGFGDGDHPKEIDKALYELAKTYKEDSDNLREALPEEVDEAYKTNVGRLAKMKEETKEDIAKDAVAIDEAKKNFKADIKIDLPLNAIKKGTPEDAIVSFLEQVIDAIKKGLSGAMLTDPEDTSIVYAEYKKS